MPVRFTVTLHVAPAAMLVQVLVWKKLVALAPVNEIPVTTSGALPLLVRMSSCAPAAVPRFVLKVSVVALSCREGAAATPVPLRAIVCGEPAALSTMLMLALKLPPADGAKLTERLHVAPAATVVPQVLVWLKLDALMPVGAIELIDRAAVPVLLRVTLWMALVAPAFAVKLSAVALSKTDGVPTGLLPPLCELLELQPDGKTATMTAATREMR